MVLEISFKAACFVTFMMVQDTIENWIVDTVQELVFFKEIENVSLNTSTSYVNQTIMEA